MEELKFLGREVRVKIDRPLNSKHPTYNFNYELNYGFIPNTIGGDGKEIDAYVMGENEVLEEYIGTVKAVIIRFNDNENKLVVASSKYPLSQNEIKLKTHFQEKHFDIEIRLNKEE